MRGVRLLSLAHLLSVLASVNCVNRAVPEQDDAELPLSPQNRDSGNDRKTVTAALLQQLPTYFIGSENDVIEGYGNYVVDDGVKAYFTSPEYPKIYTGYVYTTWTFKAYQESSSLLLYCIDNQMRRTSRLWVKEGDGRYKAFKEGQEILQLYQEKITVTLTSRRGAFGKLRCYVEAYPKVEPLKPVTGGGGTGTGSTGTGGTGTGGTGTGSGGTGSTGTGTGGSGTGSTGSGGGGTGTGSTGTGSGGTGSTGTGDGGTGSTGTGDGGTGSTGTGSGSQSGAVGINDALCGRTNYRLRIVGGEEAPKNAYPWLVGIATPGSSMPFCGGSLITERFVLTAAHCVKGKRPRQVWVLVGKHLRDNDPDQKSVRVSNINVHPRYAMQTSNNDVALLRLSESLRSQIRHSSGTVRTVCLPTSSCGDTNTCFTGRSSVVAGWGTLKSNGPTPRQVQHVTVPVVENAQCDRYYEAGSFSRGTITSKMICAGYRSGGKDSCQGDSGGPLVVKDSATYVYTLIGVVSFGYQCAEPRFPGVYARTSEFTQWIEENTRQ